MIKQFAKNLLGGVVRILPALPGGKYLFQQFLEAAMEEKLSAMHHGLRMIFCAPNELCRYRIASFSTKEPETLDWIDALPESAIVWDIGANIGIYSVYAAMKRGARVFAFEPSVFNLEILARNIDLNKLQKQITIVPIPLSERAGTSLFKMTTMAWGGALSRHLRKILGKTARS
jgi:predicted RNA methylase